MINIVLALTLTSSVAALASVPVAAVEQEKDRCVLTEDPAEKIADCQKLPRKNASLFDELARKNKKEARITTEFFVNAIHVMAGANALESGDVACAESRRD